MEWRGGQDGGNLSRLAGDGGGDGGGGESVADANRRRAVAAPSPRLSRAEHHRACPSLRLRPSVAKKFGGDLRGVSGNPIHPPSRRQWSRRAANEAAAAGAAVSVSTVLELET